MKVEMKVNYYPGETGEFIKVIEDKCTGCGRCIDNCLGDIDMREVLAGAHSYSGKKK